MKTIEVTDEMYAFLVDLSMELNSQDHRATRMPYIFQVRETKEIETGVGMGEEVWVLGGDISLRTDDDIKEAVFELKGWDMEEAEYHKLFDDLDEYDIEEILENNYRKCYITTEYTYENAFLTSKACDEHIRVNRHNLNSPVNFLTGVYRNPELEKVMRFLCELTGGKLHT